MGRIANDVAFTQNVLDHRVKGHLMVSTGDDAEKKELTTFIPQGQHMQTIHTGSDQKRRHSWTMVGFLFLWLFRMPVIKSSISHEARRQRCSLAQPAAPRWAA